MAGWTSFSHLGISQVEALLSVSAWARLPRWVCHVCWLALAHTPCQVFMLVGGGFSSVNLPRRRWTNSWLNSFGRSTSEWINRSCATMAFNFNKEKWVSCWKRQLSSIIRHLQRTRRNLLEASGSQIWKKNPRTCHPTWVLNKAIWYTQCNNAVLPETELDYSSIIYFSFIEIYSFSRLSMHVVVFDIYFLLKLCFSIYGDFR